MAVSTIRPGHPAPDFELSDDAGKKVRLSDFLGRKVILYFYPKDDTPGCTKQACGFRDSFHALTASGAVVLGVSADTAESHRKFKAKYHLPFPLLVDKYHAVADQYGVWGEKTFAGIHSTGVLRSHFVIDEEGCLVDVQVNVSPEESIRRATEAVGAPSMQRA